MQQLGLLRAFDDAIELRGTVLVYRWIDVNVSRKSTGAPPAMMVRCEFSGDSLYTEDYHE